MRYIMTVLMALVLSVCGFAQMTPTPAYYTDVTQTWVDNIPNCIVGQNTCYHQIIGAPQLSNMSIGADAYLAGVDPTGQVYQYNDYPANSFTQITAMGTTIGQIAVGNKNAIYGLAKTSVAPCVAPAKRVYKWSGTAWIEQSIDQSHVICLKDLSVGGDGQAYGLDSTSRLLYKDATGLGWSLLNAGPYTSVAAVNAGLVYATKSDNTIWVRQSKNGTTMLQTFNGVSGSAKLVVDSLSTMFEYVNGRVYRRDPDTGTWQGFAGSTIFTKPTTAGSMLTFALDTSGNVYRLPLSGIRMQTQLKGSTNCTPPAQCPNTNIHTPVMRIYFAGKHTGGQTVTYPAQKPATIVDSLNFVASDTMYDPFDCIEGFASCQLTEYVHVDCTILVGSAFYYLSRDIFIEGPYLKATEGVAVESVLETGGQNCKYVAGGNATLDSSWICDYPLRYYHCTPPVGTGLLGYLPDYQVAIAKDYRHARDMILDPAEIYGWDLYGYCIRFGIGSFKTSWACESATGKNSPNHEVLYVPYTDPVPDFNCSYNP